MGRVIQGMSSLIQSILKWINQWITFPAPSKYIVSSSVFCDLMKGADCPYELQLEILKRRYLSVRRLKLYNFAERVLSFWRFVLTTSTPTGARRYWSYNSKILVVSINLFYVFIYFLSIPVSLWQPWANQAMKNAYTALGYSKCYIIME